MPERERISRIPSWLRRHLTSSGGRINKNSISGLGHPPERLRRPGAMLPQGSNGSGYYPEQFYPTNGGRLPGSTDSLRRQASFEVQLPLFSRQLQGATHSGSPKTSHSTKNGHRQSQNGHKQSQKPPPMKEDRADVLVILAETYFSRAHTLGMAASVSEDSPQAQTYYKLVAAGLGCLEAVLKVGRSQRWWTTSKA